MSRRFLIDVRTRKRQLSEANCGSENLINLYGDMDFYVFPCGPLSFPENPPPPPFQNPKNPLLNQIPIISHNTGHATLVSLNSLSRCPTPDGLKADEGRPMLSWDKILADES